MSLSADGVLWRELWSSFASLLRSYCAAHGLGREHQAILDVSAERITVRVHLKMLVVSQHDGIGSVRHVDGREEPLKILEDGHVMVGERMEAMDMAAEALAREAMSGC